MFLPKILKSTDKLVTILMFNIIDFGHTNLVSLENKDALVTEKQITDKWKIIDNCLFKKN